MQPGVLTLLQPGPEHIVEDPFWKLEPRDNDVILRCRAY